MLKRLHIQNIAIIDTIEAEFHAGLNVMTGETGAGKSIIIDALGLALGNRASSGLIRAGENSAQVTAVFQNPGGRINQIIEEIGAEVEDELILRRSITASGGSRSYINDTPVNLNTLGRIGAHLVTIHGQGEGDQLLTDAGQRQFVDSFAGIAGDVEQLGVIWNQLKAARQELDEITSDVRERRRQRDFLSFQINEIESAKLEIDEEQELEKERSILENAERLKELSGTTHYQVYEDEDSLLNRISSLEVALEEIAQVDPEWSSRLESVESMRYQLEELARDLGSFSDSVEGDPQRLRHVESRLDVYATLQKKYGNTTAEVLTVLEELKQEFEKISAGEERLHELEDMVQRLENDYRERARHISARRKEKSGELAQSVRQHLADLAMGKARLEVAVEPHPRGETSTGLDRVTFHLQANPGSAPRPLHLVASGGEQSRIMLAVKSVLLEDGDTRTLIFDEIDAGVGGKVAEFVGRKLKRIAGNHQTLCITHLAQVACQAGSHYVIEKTDTQESTSVTLRPVDDSNKVEELARMIGGESISETTRSLAREMLSQADNI